jgi:hypothetical protein
MNGLQLDFQRLAGQKGLNLTKDDAGAYTTPETRTAWFWFESCSIMLQNRGDEEETA